MKYLNILVSQNKQIETVNAMFHYFDIFQRLKSNQRINQKKERQKERKKERKKERNPQVQPYTKAELNYYETMWHI